jgi:drug/metabolite transporter (DMT)-like permease
VKGKGLIYAALIATTMVWGGSFVAIKQALHYLSPTELLFMRFAPAALAYGLLLMLSQRQALAGLLRAEWLALCAMGLFGVLIYHLAVYTGQQFIPAATASLVMALNPAFIFVMSVLFLGERVTWMRTLGLCVAFVGLFIVVRFASGEQVSFHYVRGVLITLIAPLAWAAYTVISRPLAARHPPLAVTGMGTILGAMPILGAAPFLGTEDQTLLQALAFMPWDGWASVAFLALLCTVGGGTVWVAALQHLHASRVGVFMYLVPLWGVLLSQLLLGERLTLPLVVGAAVITGGVMMVNR